MKMIAATPELLREWSTLIQLRVLEAMPRVVPLMAKQFAFHGGTSLNLSWRSPRFSEDLDFLLSKDVASIPEIMKKTVDHVQSSLLLTNPDIRVEIKDKSKSDRLANFHISVSSDRYHGKAMVKVELWRVDQSYMDSYQSVFVTPVRNGDYISRSSSPIPAATLDAAFADKITAFATRPFLKWRDMFDFWWINQQSPQDIEAAAKRFMHHVSAYKTINQLSPADALRYFITRDEDSDLLAKSDPDLKKWLPIPLWEMLHPNGVMEMIAYTKTTLESIADEVDRFSNNESMPCK